MDVLGLNPPNTKRAQDFRVLVRAAGADDFELILDHDGDGWFFHAPLHPVNPGDGGSVEALKAMPAADVPPALLPLKLSQAYLDSDADDNDLTDLTDLAANTHGFLTAAEVDLLDRLFGAFELESLLRADIDEGHDLPSLPASSKRSPRAVDLCINAGPEIETAPELSIYMTRSAVARFGADPNSEAGRTLAFGATALTGMGLLPGPAGKTAAIAGTVIAAVQGATEAVAGLLPSRFVSITCEVDQTSFDEDDPGYATYSNVIVTPKEAGSDQLRVAAQSTQFGRREIHMDIDMVVNVIHVGVTPADTCIHNGETVPYRATVTGFAEGEYTINWAVTEGWGTIDQNGVYHAPPGGSTNDVVTATVVEDSTVHDTANVDVGACNCSLDIYISGAYVWHKAGSQAAYSVSDFGGNIFYQFYFGFDFNGPPLISASLGTLEGEPTPIPGTTGSWPVSFSFSSGTQTWSASPLAEHGGVTLTITELTETSMVGYLRGTAVQLDENTKVSSTVNIDVDMRAGQWIDGWPCE